MPYVKRPEFVAFPERKRDFLIEARLLWGHKGTGAPKVEERFTTLISDLLRSIQASKKTTVIAEYLKDQLPLAQRLKGRNALRKNDVINVLSGEKLLASLYVGNFATTTSPFEGAFYRWRVKNNAGEFISKESEDKPKLAYFYPPELFVFLLQTAECGFIAPYFFEEFVTTPKYKGMV